MRNTDTERVVFRVYPEGDVIALFPDQPEGMGRCTCYQHVGQHGTAHYHSVIAATRPAKRVEWSSLWRELDSMGYKMRLGFRAKLATFTPAPWNIR